MKTAIFPFGDVSVDVNKGCLGGLAKATRKKGKVANIFCGIQKNFSESKKEGQYDITLEELVKDHPDIATERALSLAKYIGTNPSHITALLGIRDRLQIDNEAQL